MRNMTPGQGRRIFQKNVYWSAIKLIWQNILGNLLSRLVNMITRYLRR